LPSPSSSQTLTSSSDSSDSGECDLVDIVSKWQIRPGDCRLRDVGDVG
jgi:homogentisate 1,2-dioxygenase